MAVNLKIVSQVVASGAPGPAGKSAYQIAVDNGFQGTESEWLKELHPFKGWFDSVSDLETSHANPIVGDYAYVKGATSSDPVKIYKCSTEGTWSDSGRTVDTSTVQTFRSGEAVNDVDITDDSSDIEENSDKIPTAGAVADALGNVEFSTGQKVKNVGIDNEPTAGSENLVTSGGIQNELALGAVYDVSAKNPTAGPNNDGKWESLSALLSDANLSTLIPTSVRKGGMSIKFVESSSNEYVQYRYMQSDVREYIYPGNWRSVEYDFDEIAQTGKNLFDKNSVTIGLVTSDGSINSGYTVYRTSFYIPVISGKTYLFCHGTIPQVNNDVARIIAFYDSTRTILTGEWAYISSTSPQFGYATAIANAAYMRISVLATEIDTIMVCESSRMDFIYSPYQKEVIPSKILNFDGNSIIDNSLSLKKTAFANRISGKNLYNKNDYLVISGYYISNSGALAFNNTYFTTGFIPIDATKYYKFSRNNSVALSARFALLYDINKVPLADGYLVNVNGLEPHTNAAYLRASFSASYKDVVQIEEGTSVTTYEAYSETYKIKREVLPEEENNIPDNSISLKKMIKTSPISSSLGSNGKSATSASLAVGGNLALTDFPYYIKQDVKISFEGNITTLGTFYLGKGYQSNSGVYIKIDDTNITPINCSLGGTGTEGTPIAHGLTLSTYVKVAILVHKYNATTHSSCTFVLQTLGGQFVTELTNWWLDNAGSVFVKSASTSGLVASDIKLSAVYADIQKQVWFVGDSYLSLGDPKRYLYQIKQLGITNFLVEGLSGGSTQVYEDFINRTVNYGTPKFLVWCLGMNYGSDTDENTPASTWLDEVTTVKNFCEANGITLVMATIPCTATLNHTGKNKYIRESGLQYIDLAKAVNGSVYTSGTNNWYEGYCDDGTHPTQLGAKALSSQVLVDFPEIMRCVNS